MSNPEFEDFENDDKSTPEADRAAVAAEEQTEAETRSAADSDSRVAESSFGSRLSFLRSLTIYDAMLIASALSISLAILLMFLELSSFGFFFQWRTGEAYAEPITPP